MEFIITRGFPLPTNQKEMENLDWYNMWRKKWFPYNELLRGDILYWFETKSQRLVWKTKIMWVHREQYSDKKKILDTLKPNPFGNQYSDSKPDKGYFLRYKIKVIERLDIPKPPKFKFSELGWLRVDSETTRLWFGRNEIQEDNVLDDNVTNIKGTLIEQLSELNSKMKNVSPVRIEKLIASTIRKDTKIINAIKAAADFRCQFPDCGKQIKKKSGGFYVEVAHIKPVAKGGQSILGNLLVLCPNHHKEFDFGALSITSQTIEKLTGILNAKSFEIKLTK